MKNFFGILLKKIDLGFELLMGLGCVGCMGISNNNGP